MGSLAKPVVCIVTPGTRTANNGNWRTAIRWASMLRDHCKVIVQTEWQGPPPDVLIALHARRSAASVQRLRETAAGTPLVVMLTGTDLYRDLPASVEARASLDAADRIVTLQEDAPRLLEPAWRRKCEVIFQSAKLLAGRAKPRGALRAIAVGHLRPEKDPATLFAALRLIPREVDLRLRHLGAPLDEALAAEARRLQRDEPRYAYAGALPHGLTRAAIKGSHVLVHPSAMEGGANVIVEAVTADTAVIASRISGNVGMLGRDYPGYFEPGDAQGLAGCLRRAAGDRAYLRSLLAACRARRKLFDPRTERKAVLTLVQSLLQGGR